MSKKGRKGMNHGLREPNGRLSRAAMAAVEGVPPANAKRLRDLAARGVGDAVWGSELGHLFLDGKLTPDQYEAGRRWGRLTTSYLQAIGARPPNATAQRFERYEPSAEPDPNSIEGRKRIANQQDIIKDWKGAEQGLTDAGLSAKRAVRSLCEANECPVGHVGLVNLQAGLSALVRVWELNKGGS